MKRAVLPERELVLGRLPRLDRSAASGPPTPSMPFGR